MKIWKNPKSLFFKMALVLTGVFILTGASSYQVNNGAAVDITEHSTCKTVTNNHASGKAVFVPTATSTEWTQFYTNPPAGVTAVDCPSGFVFNATISTNTTNYNMRAAAVTAGWNQTDALIATVTINSGIVVYSTSTATPAFDSGATFPVGSSLTIVNNGSIIGKGGNGGVGGSTSNGACGAAGGGGAGGPALTVALATTVTNNGNIYGGGGGGGGGGSTFYSGRGCIAETGGGGGGGQSYSGTSAGGGGSNSSACATIYIGGAGGGGTSAGAGGGGAGGYWTAGKQAGNGAGGGGYGAAGGTGGAGIGGTTCNLAGAGGGAGGAAVNGNANITWNATGTRLGAINN